MTLILSPLSCGEFKNEHFEKIRYYFQYSGGLECVTNHAVLVRTINLFYISLHFWMCC